MIMFLLSLLSYVFKEKWMFFKHSFLNYYYLGGMSHEGNWNIGKDS
jgi:hypothetical protein